MKIGIVGLPNVGKSTLFNALTKSYAADAGNFPFCTIDPNVGIVDVKDPRVDALADLSQSKKKIHAAIEFVDIAGLVRGASKGEGLGNKFLANIREVDAIVQVLRNFEDSDVSHVEGDVDPVRDVEIINTELMVADLETVEKQLPNMAKKAKSGDSEVKKLVTHLTQIKSGLEAGQMIYDIIKDRAAADKKSLKQYNFLTNKPFVYAINVNQDDLGDATAIQEQFQQKLDAPIAIVCAKLEEEMLDFADDEKAEFLQELIQVEHTNRILTLDDLIQLAYQTVGLMYYFTTGEKETKAWTIPIGSTAPQAAGAIHTDFERGFIKAEVVNAQTLLDLGSRSKAKEAGKLKLEGKTYVVQDGDVMVFKFNV